MTGSVLLIRCQLLYTQKRDSLMETTFIAVWIFRWHTLSVTERKYNEATRSENNQAHLQLLWNNLKHIIWTNCSCFYLLSLQFSACDDGAPDYPDTRLIKGQWRLVEAGDNDSPLIYRCGKNRYAKSDIRGIYDGGRIDILAGYFNGLGDTEVPPLEFNAHLKINLLLTTEIRRLPVPCLRFPFMSWRLHVTGRFPVHVVIK